MSETVTGKVTLFQLLQWQSWLRMEENFKTKGLGPIRHSSGRSVKAFAARRFGLGPRTKRDVVLSHVDAAVTAAKEAGCALLSVIDLVRED